MMMQYILKADYSMTDAECTVYVADTNSNTFAVHKAADHNNGDPVVMALGGVGGEVRGVNSVGNNRYYLWVEGCTEHGVLLTGVRHAHSVVGVAQRHGQKLVGQHGTHISKAEERVVSEDLQRITRFRFISTYDFET